ncbi:MAG: hypothetical protein K2X00_12735 [Nitrospiraceae bacterium]|nr:hypothetical protein [Nitrospiraceae bacterium]OQW64630.1 MAG: hypothetical protein BVN29_12525 [Nitrospira sp. ST-bin5]
MTKATCCGAGSGWNFRRLFIFLRVCAGLGLLIDGQQARAEWRVTAESEAAWTDNVVQYSAAFAQALQQDPSFPTGDVRLVGSDVIWKQAAELQWLGTVSAQPSRVSVSGQGLFYTDKSAFNRGIYRLDLRQALGSKHALFLRYESAPQALLGQGFEKRTGSRLVQEVRVTSHIGYMEIERRLSDAWQATIEGRVGERAFNESFAQRDVRFWTLGPRLQWTGSSGVVVTGGYLYEQGLADQMEAARFNDDASYINHVVSLDLRIPFLQSWTLGLDYVYRVTRFTSDLPGDSFNGRRDVTQQGSAELEYRWTDRVAVVVGFRRTQRLSTVAAVDFHSTIALLGLRYRLQ